MFELQLVISFLVGGLLISLQSLIAERVPSKWKGVVLTVPTTMAIGFFFTGLVKSPADISEIAIAVPATLAVTYVFIASMALLAKYGLVVSLLVSNLIWFLGAYILIVAGDLSLELSLGIFLVLITGSYLVIDNEDKPLKSFPMIFSNVAVRALFAGVIVVGVVYLSKTLGNIWGALMAVFPASMTSTLLIYFKTQGSEVIPFVSRSMFFPGSIGFVLYALVAGWSFPIVGIWWGTLVSYLSVFVFFGVWKFELRRRSS